MMQSTKQIKTLVEGGKAIFTLTSKKLQKSFTFSLRHDNKDKIATRYLAYKLYGPDNTKDYRLIGIYYSDSGKYTPVPLGEGIKASSQLFLSQFLSILNTKETLPDTCIFQLAARCVRCGRLLTTPESIERGAGPDCAEYLGV